LPGGFQDGRDRGVQAGWGDQHKDVRQGFEILPKGHLLNVGGCGTATPARWTPTSSMYGGCFFWTAEPPMQPVGTHGEVRGGANIQVSMGTSNGWSRTWPTR
jgi:hypothetical protein